MRVLIVTKIFPNAVEPALAPYNRHQFGALARRCDVDILALVPWLPGATLFDKEARRRSQVPRHEQIDELKVSHPRVVYAPRAGRPLSGLLCAASLLPQVLARWGKIDVILGSFAYPDGWAAVALARLMRVPAVIKVHGSDINIYEHDPLIRPNLKWALSGAAAVVGPSQALVDKAVALGADARMSTPIANGVHKHLFKPRDRAASRAALKHTSERPWLLFVGRLERAKGIVELLEAFAIMSPKMPEIELVLVGRGVDEAFCREFVEKHQLPVIFAGVRPPEEVAIWLGASDWLTLPSWAEGTPNVVLEALASGRRVVASNVGGIPAVLDDERLGLMVPPKDSAALAVALERVAREPYDPEAVMELAAVGDWEDSGEQLYRVLQRAVGAPDSG